MSTLPWRPSDVELAACLPLEAGGADGALATQCIHRKWHACVHTPPNASDRPAVCQVCRRDRTRGPADLTGAPPAHSPPRRAWVTMLHGNVVNYTTQALVQALSARMFSCLEHIVLVTPDVELDIRRRLINAGSQVSEIPFISWKNQPKARVKQVWKHQMTKLLAWNLSAFDQVAYIDSDIFMVHPGVDEIFRLCARASADLCAGKEYGNSQLNSGLLVVRPSGARFKEILQHLDAFVRSNAVSPDMAFLKHEYRLRLEGSRLNYSSRVELFNVIGTRWDRNVWRDDVFHTCPELSRRAYRYGSVQKKDVRRRIQRVRLWHACGVHKLERLPRCHLGGAPHAFCTTRVMRLFQWLHSQANPCIDMGVTPAICSAGGECKWCSAGIRCVPRTWNCHLNATETVAVETRMRGVIRG